MLFRSIVIMAGKELYMVVSGCLVIRKTGKVHGADWHGALDGSFLNEDLLDLVQFPILLQTFDGQDALAFQLAGSI